MRALAVCTERATAITQAGISVCEQRSRKPPTTIVSTYSSLRLGLLRYDVKGWSGANSCTDLTWKTVSRGMPEGDRMIRTW